MRSEDFFLARAKNGYKATECDANKVFKPINSAVTITMYFVQSAFASGMNSIIKNYPERIIANFFVEYFRVERILAIKLV